MYVLYEIELQDCKLQLWLIVGGIFINFKVEETYVNGVPHADDIIIGGHEAWNSELQVCVKMGYENEVPFGTEIEINSSGATAKHKAML
jgi:hypothetical protein